MDLARLAGLDHEAGLQARAAADEVVVHAADGDQRRDRDALGVDAAVGEDQHVDAVLEDLLGLGAHAVERLQHALGPVGDRPRDVERVGAEDLGVDLAQLLQLGVAQDRRLHAELVGVLGRLVEQVLLGADAGRHAHHHGLADRVDRRVGDLREELLEVGEQQRRLLREHGQRRVVAHRADRLLALRRGRREQDAQVLLGPAERALQRGQRLRALVLRLPRGKVGEVHDALVEPLAVRPAGGDGVLDLAVVDDPALRDVDQEELAGLQAALAQHVLGRLVHHAGLRAHHDPAVAGLQPAAGAQAVAVERGADDPPVGEGDGGGAVPRLHQAGVEGVEALELVGEVVAAVEGLGDHHHHRVRQRAAGEREQLEDVVEGGGVRAAGAHDRQHLRQVVAEQLGGELGLAGAHPVDVAAQRVDLAVVGDHPVRVRELPAREGVGGEARVDQRQRALGARVLQVGEVAHQLRRREHALVDDRARGEARDHELRPGGQLGDAADHVELALERVLVVLELALGGDDEVLDVRGEVVGRDADVVLVDRHVAPADHALALGLDGVLEQLLERRALLLVLGEEADADAVAPRGREVAADETTHQLVGHLHEDPRAVAGVRVGARGAAVLEVLQRDDRAADRLVRRVTIELRDERDAASVVLIGWVVQADRLGRPGNPMQERAPVRRGWGGQD